MQKKERTVKVKSIFLYDIDGIFKSVPLSRFQSIFSNFLNKNEKLDFLLFGRPPVKVLKLLDEQKTFNLRSEINYLGLDIYITLEDIGAETYDDYMLSLPKKEYIPLLVFVRTFDQTKAILFTEDGVFGDKSYLKFFVRKD